MSHTKEPWSVAEESFDNDGIQESVIRGIDGRAAIAVTLEFGKNNPAMRQDNARRIVACVNACAGIETHELELMTGRMLIANQIKACDDIYQSTEAKAARRSKFARQRDELLDALYLALPFVEDHEGSPCYKSGVVDNAVKKIRAALGSVVIKDSLITESSIPAIVFYPAGSLGEEVSE